MTTVSGKVDNEKGEKKKKEGKKEGKEAKEGKKDEDDGTKKKGEKGEKGNKGEKKTSKNADDEGKGKKSGGKGGAKAGAKGGAKKSQKWTAFRWQQLHKDTFIFFTATTLDTFFLKWNLYRDYIYNKGKKMTSKNVVVFSFQ